MTDKSFTGRGRRRATKSRVFVVEKAARYLITAGGIGTIIAVSLIFVFLVWVVMPLFLGANVQESGAQALAAERGSAPVRIGTEENLHLFWSLEEDGTVVLRRVDSGELVTTVDPFDGNPPTAFSFNAGASDVVFGFADGTIREGTIGFETTFLPDDETTASFASLQEGDVATSETGVVVRTPTEQLRATDLVTAVDGEVGNLGSEIVLVDHSIAPGGIILAALASDGTVRVSKARVKPNLLTGETRRTFKHVEVPFDPPADGSFPTWIRLAGIGEDLYLAWPDGTLQHFDLRDFAAPKLVGVVDLVEEADGALTSFEFLLGKTTLLAGDSLGRVRSYFPVRDEAGSGEIALQSVRDMPVGDSPVRTISLSARSRLVAVTYEDGAYRLVHATSGSELLSVEAPEPAVAALIAPKEDALLGVGKTSLAYWRFDPRYPEASLAGLFLPVWYEGGPEPEHVWQSAGGTDDFEPKLGLVPLIFGTLKATIYSMLFGAPIALLAAIFSSEFLSPRLRTSVKATVELMAGLPSVVLGFLAALVIAPFVQSVVPAVLVGVVTLPLTMLLGAHIWQLLPPQLVVRWAGVQRFLLIGLTIPIAVFAGRAVGPFFERLVFGGDLKLWLDGQVGSALGGWFYLFLPLAACVVAVLSGRFVAPRVRTASQSWSRTRLARFEFLKFVAWLAASAVVALVIAYAFSATGADSRGSVFGTYVDRNAMIVGFVMGFAIIPIIYTLADDALTEVPMHLREASLGAGATQWQTATRVVIPTAMSGLFSALMIGLGRSVGETMIVLMAAGNTAIMDWNVFNGFRTLSANIATELPEAVRNSAHYRTLFLAALVLFAMTFLLNTIAEGVRRHFRKKTHAL